MVAVFKRLTLDMTGIPEGKRKAAKKAVLNVIENETTRALSKGQSPVKGEIFPKLKKTYADEFKQGDQTPNLQLEGDMLEAIEYSTLPGDEIGWGFSDGSTQSDKADGHNQFSADAKKPIWKNGSPKLSKRRFIPENNQVLKPSVTRLMDEALDKFRSKNISTERALETDTVGDIETTSLEFEGSLFSDQTIVSALLKEL